MLILCSWTPTSCWQSGEILRWMLGKDGDPVGLPRWAHQSVKPLQNLTSLSGRGFPYKWWQCSNILCTLCCPTRASLHRWFCARAYQVQAIPHKNTCAISRGIQKSCSVVVTGEEVVTVQLWALMFFSYRNTFLGLGSSVGWLLVLVGWGSQLSNCVIIHLSTYMFFCIYHEENHDL